MPSSALLTLVLIVAIALVFDFINGFHDTANAIATSVATRVLAPGTAVLMAGVLNVAGALTGTAVASTVGKGIVPPADATQLLVVAALLSAIAWDLITWRYGIPSSSSDQGNLLRPAWSRAAAAPRRQRYAPPLPSARPILAWWRPHPGWPRR